MSRRWSVVVPLLVLVACSDTPREEDSAPDPDEGDCGGYVVTNVDRDGTPGRSEAQECLLDAFADGDQATVDVELTTIEGDPIFYRYTIVDRRVVEVRTDTTHDQYGTPAVTTERCTELTVVDDLLTAEGCAPA